MEDRTRTLIVTGAILLIIAAIIIGTIYFIARFFQTRQAGTPRVSPSPRASIIATGSAQPVGSINPDTSTQPGGNTTQGTKPFQNNYFSLNYQPNWGILTCSNSVNVEFDPTNSQENRGVTCDYALKPVTIIALNDLSCQGEQLTLGQNSVVRSVDTSKGGETSYRWCVEGGTVDLEVTHRVSNTGSRATSGQDFSKQVEQLISTIRFPQAS